MKRVKYLITGGAGFIGANFVKYLLSKHAQDVDILVLDALTYAGNLATISDEIETERIKFVKGDINDRDLVDALFADFDPDFVVNFAAESHVDRSIENPRLFLETNVMGTQTLLDAARRHWQITPGVYREGKKFLQISTDEVYGSLTRDYDSPRQVCLPENLASIVGRREDVAVFGEGMFTEATPIAPRSPYSAAKASADMLVMAYFDTYGLPVNITRCSNNYGPWHFPEKLIPLVIKNVREGKEIPVYGKGLNVRDWLYVEDHVRAIDMVLRKGRIGEIYN
ncbi:MAG: GDP-mannose 4,6-dehydratase, partial [Muribaculaceae bacterium]|nr:GDP-mannose 4,6-dehydratase [Muribaculaceae bacterium]